MKRRKYVHRKWKKLDIVGKEGHMSSRSDGERRAEKGRDKRWDVT